MSEQMKRIGIIVPSSNIVAETDFQRLSPKNVVTHTARMFIHTVDEDSVASMDKEVERCAQHLGSAKLDAIAYTCTGGSFFGGMGFDLKLVQRIVENSGGIPTVATSSAMVDALRLRGVKKVSVVTPYQDWLNEKMQVFLEGNGFDVLTMNGQQIEINTEIGDQTPETIMEFAKSHLSPEADGLFLSCTNWRAIEVVDQLEREIGKPVVSSVQATIWAAFKAVGITEPIKGYGKLLESLE